jgi:hypothetical protein
MRGLLMKVMTKIGLAPAAALLLSACVPVEPEVGVGVNVGPEPDCPYGYYDFAPYHCAPYGYYGPEWFLDGAFIGVGPWFHGPHDFRGYVDNRFDVRNGYNGALPMRGEARMMHPGFQFHGNEFHDGGGHIMMRR